MCCFFFSLCFGLSSLQLNSASSYEERAEIRKALRELKAASSSAKPAASSSAGYRRPGGLFHQPAQPSPVSSRAFVNSTREASSPASRPAAKSTAVTESKASPRTTRPTPRATEDTGRSGEAVTSFRPAASATAEKDSSLTRGVLEEKVEKPAEQARVRSPTPAEEVKAESRTQRSPSPAIAEPSRSAPVPDQHHASASQEDSHQRKEVDKEKEAVQDTQEVTVSRDASAALASSKETSESVTKMDPIRSRHETGESVSSNGSLLDGDDGDEEEEAIERQVREGDGTFFFFRAAIRSAR